MEKGPHSQLIFDADTLILDAQVRDLAVLQALNIRVLKARGAINDAFAHSASGQHPNNLGQGIWLNDSLDGNLISAVAISRPRESFLVDGHPVALLVTVSVADGKALRILGCLSTLLSQGQGERLLSADSAALLMLLTQDETNREPTPQSADFEIRNEYGIHARPGAVLVNIIKQFKSDITVTNLDGTGRAASGRSLMKIVALGAKKGHRLRFTACGEDALPALKAIGEGIANGLGEEVA
ncbi:HPr family phosphocarrier protein [Erwinia sp. CPCC 100877]|nr:HPr family phosphocarrier protein [Erwinia sp. CPCC 100877]